jgi:hypothetical protein
MMYLKKLKPDLIMKKFFLLSMFIAILGSCSSLDSKSQSGLKGNWMISSVTYPGSDYIKVTSFDIADSKCFEGSSWNFISMSNKGTMTKEGAFTLKITEGEKAKRVTQGYFLQLRNQTESSFQLVDNVSVGGQNVEVVYQFQKV